MIKDIFSNQVNQLSRLMKNLSKDKYFDMDMQFKMNTSIFKANFENGNQNNRDDGQQQEQINQQNQQQVEQNSYDGQIQQQQPQQQQQVYNQYNTLQQQQLQQQQQQQQLQQQNQQNQSKNQAQNQQQQQQSQLQNQNQGIKKLQQYPQQQSQYNSLQINNSNVSGVLNISGDGWVRKQLKNNADKNQYNSNISINNNNSQMLNKSGVDLYEGKRGNIVKNTSNINLSVLSNRKKTSNYLLQNTSKASISSVRSANSISKIGGQVPFSEISGIQDQNFRAQSPGLNSSFSRAPRDLDRSSFDQSPGPSDYNPNNSINKVRQASPSTKFGKSARISWIDEKLRYDSSVQTPGAIYDYNKKSLSKPLKSNKKQ
ncbi:hypothetical protein PPERSA_09125 [Pseudocohnilembus persalinus]|uniref:Uncharacterized protein n=1 Tax=Pseudocohnilembus persalinus TaxID=266149 RepID=A0A0V0QWE0_PSEPJ|nr:hypothetical protein PPERSA_09125 [Pseudocohnilembus persalinus]|eukprot:KRX06723.1 hypothetical protein PPERSA_09125 [Pseudocohnilembus persalinus]